MIFYSAANLKSFSKGKTCMPSFQDNSAQRVKEAADIVEVVGEHVPLQKAGVRYKGLCPFHSEKTPSFTVNRERQFFHCFGCKESGDVLSFMMKYHNMTFQDALASLAQRYGVELEERNLSPEERQKAREREALHRANEAASLLFHDFLAKNPAAQKAREYLEKRGINQEITDRFQLGYAPDRWDFLCQGLARAEVEQDVGVAAGLLVKKDKGGLYDRFRDRIMFPIFSLTGQVAAFGGRILHDGQPKYMNSPESAVFNKSQTLFGLYQNKEAIRRVGRCLVVEGNFDLLSLVAYGFDYVAAPLGTALTSQHIRVLKRYTSEVVVLFDGDQAGLKAAMRAVPLFLTEQMDAKIVVLPPDHDPDTFLQTFGKEALEEKVTQAMDLPEFVFARLVNEYGLSLAGKNKIVKELRPLITAIGNRKLQQSLFVSHFSEKLGLKADELLGNQVSPDVSRPMSLKKPQAQVADLSTKQRQLLEFILVYPDVLPQFLEAGIEEITGGENDPASVILRHIQKTILQDGCGPEVLLDKMDGAEKAFVARMLVDAPSYSDEMKKDLSREMVGWVKKQVLQVRKSRLVQRINEAQHEGDEILLMELLEKKKEMDEVPYT